jgi:hypothetical protein
MVSSLMLLAGFVVSLRYGLVVFARVYLVVGGLATVVQIAAKLWAAGITPWRYVQVLSVPVLATASGLAAAVVVGMHPAGWGKWAMATGTYGGVVILFYALARGSIIGALRERMASGRAAPAASSGG